MKKIFTMLFVPTAFAAAISGCSEPSDYSYETENIARVRIKEGYGIEPVFDMVNSTNLDIKVIHSGGYKTPMSWGEMQMMLVDLRSKPYIEWNMGTYYSQGEATFSVSLIDIKDPVNQTDWLRTMASYAVVSGPESGHSVDVLMGKRSEKDLQKALQGFDIVDRIENISGGDVSSGSLESVDSKVMIRPVETYTTRPRTVSLMCSTQKMYPCANYPIIATKEQSGNTIDISFKGVPSDIGICLTAIGPASTTIELGTLAEGTYILNMRNGRVTQSVRLTVTDESYSFEMADSPAFGFTEPVLRRIPEHTIWGSVSYMSDTFPDAPERFFEQIEALGAVKTEFEAGWYREFAIGDDGFAVQPPLDNPNHPRRRRLFVYRYTGDLLKVGALVEQWGHDHGDNNYVDVAVYTDMGAEFLSWMSIR